MKHRWLWQWCWQWHGSGTCRCCRASWQTGCHLWCWRCKSCWLSGHWWSWALWRLVKRRCGNRCWRCRSHRRCLACCSCNLFHCLRRRGEHRWWFWCREASCACGCCRRSWHRWSRLSWNSGVILEVLWNLAWSPRQEPRPLWWKLNQPSKSCTQGQLCKVGAVQSLNMVPQRAPILKSFFGWSETTGVDGPKRGPSARVLEWKYSLRKQTHGPGVLGNHIWGLPRVFLDLGDMAILRRQELNCGSHIMLSLNMSDSQIISCNTLVT